MSASNTRLLFFFFLCLFLFSFFSSVVILLWIELDLEECPILLILLNDWLAISQTNVLYAMVGMIMISLCFKIEILFHKISKNKNTKELFVANILFTMWYVIDGKLKVWSRTIIYHWPLVSPKQNINAAHNNKIIC